MDRLVKGRRQKALPWMGVLQAFILIISLIDQYLRLKYSWIMCTQACYLQRLPGSDWECYMRHKTWIMCSSRRREPYTFLSAIFHGTFTQTQLNILKITTDYTVVSPLFCLVPLSNTIEWCLCCTVFVSKYIYSKLFSIYWKSVSKS